jgi:hypothetical protein
MCIYSQIQQLISFFSVPIEYLKLNTFLKLCKKYYYYYCCCIFGKYMEANGYMHGVTGSLVLIDKIE